MTGGQTSALRHTLVVHASPAELAAQLSPFVRNAVVAGRATYVNLARANLDALQIATGPSSGSVNWTDTDAWMPHPARRLRAIEDLLAREAAAGRRVSFVGSCAWPTGPDELVREWERFDAALEEILDEYAAAMCCVCDASVVPADVVDRCRSIHSQLGVDPVTANDDAIFPREFLATARAEALPIPSTATRLSGKVTPGTARRFLHDAFSEATMSHERCDDLTVVLSELVTNSCQAGAQTVTVAFWRGDHGSVLQVDDDGRGFDEPHAGYRRPPAESENGRGVWIARQLADVVEVVPRRPGVSVRVHLYDSGAIVPASTLAAGASVVHPWPQDIPEPPAVCTR